MSRVSNTRKNVNILQGKITCDVCKSIMHQKVNKKENVNQYVCKNSKCGNSINRQWLYQIIRLILDKHIEESDLDKIYIKKSIELIENRKTEIRNKLIRLNGKKTRLIINKENYLKPKSLQEYNLELNEINKLIATKTDENTKLIERGALLKNKNKSQRKSYSKKLENLKVQIKDIIYKVLVEQEQVQIHFSWYRAYYIDKPNSTLLSWEKRDENKLYKYELPKRIYNIEELTIEETFESLSYEIDEEKLDRYFESDEYLEKLKNRFKV